MYIWLTAGVIFIVDRISKMVVVNNLQLWESIPVIPGFFHLTYILNPGAAFGMMAGKSWFFAGTAVIVLGGILYFQRSIAREEKLMRLCIGLIAGGAAGNLYDRLFIGQVIDFLDFKVWSYIFNVADSAVVVGGIALVILLYRHEKKDPSGLNGPTER